ncbi:rhomboid family intramembrane serine protease [Candidatus Nanosalina sp. VS9-1]|uniref:rhomboid family intramembrane serine protease n=1 Tax=Candidatus Nanosalina sp. VS9-1 TaxID=3388566 RepID=UPI0039DF4401
MAECSECGKQTMSFTCHYCGEKFCSEHRLPENHDCEGLDSGKKEEYLNKGEEKEEASDEKWFDEKFESQDVKKEVHRNRRSTGLGNDILSTLKNNYTLSIIALTSFSFMLQFIVPGYFNNLVLNPAVGYLVTHPWSLLTVMILHAGLFHLMANMITFYFFGSILEKAIGSKEMLKFYIGTGLISSLAYVLMSNIYSLLHGAAFSSGIGTMTPAVGASGAVVAAVGAVAMLYPQAEVLLYFVIPMKIQTAVKAFGAIEVLNLTSKLMGTTLPVIGGFASSAHLAGLIIGLIIGKRMRKNVSRTSRIDLFQA